MATLPKIPGAKKKGVVLFSGPDDFKKLEEHLINDTVCVDGPWQPALELARRINEKYKVAVKVVGADKIEEALPAEIERVDGPIQEIVGEGRAEAVKFKNGKAVGVSLVIFIGGIDMSADVLVKLGEKGTDVVLDLTRKSLEGAIKEKTANAPLSFPETNYYFPLINALLNIEVKNLGDCLKAFQQADGLAKGTATKTGLVIPALGGILNKGIATLLCEEILAALAVMDKKHPTPGTIGFIPDKILRSLGLQLVDGRIAGIAVILGPAKDADAATELIRSFQSKGIVSLLVGNINGNTFSKQLEDKGISMGLENYIVPLGDDYLSAIYAVNFAVRAPLIFGGFKPGQWQEMAGYIRNRVPAFVLLLGNVDEVIVATGLGVLAFGLPIVTDLDVPQLGKIDTTLYEALVTEKDYKKIPERCILARGIKIKLTQVDVPVSYAAAFEGERVRKEQLHAEFGGKASSAFEYLTTKGADEVEDGRVELIGPDIDQLTGGNKSLPLAIIVEVYGRKMQKDFEPVLERQIHRFVNYAMGLMHVGQRDMNWIRISKEAFSKGFRLKHIGVVLHAMLHQEYSAIVDKVQVKLYTKQEDVDKLLVAAKNTFDERDERISGMSDESVDTYYSCLLCQSFAPNHVCIVTPERLGLCGAYSWLDAKASFEIIPTGPNQPIPKGVVVDQKLGQWANVNNFVKEKSNKTIEKVSMYSLMDSPQSSCGCFECIVAIIPEAAGVMVVHRDHSGITPCGMSFTTLAGSVGGGVQTPGFLGVGKLYVASKKFIAAEGGLKRLVWMPKELKEQLADKLKKRAAEIGEPDLFDKIADETQATTCDELVAFLNKVHHPVLDMEPLM
ncbi:MAG: acetyl-CoA decarbonylase/synthase complex subunit alpha/beta [Candidatus Omnitrophica bacterium]|nr:acetyl-CoA decarbonylase/synthase complex subunit alpha/beta [Candidatus Omnitrophota bacterium]